MGFFGNLLKKKTIGIKMEGGGVGGDATFFFQNLITSGVGLSEFSNSRSQEK